MQYFLLTVNGQIFVYHDRHYYQYVGEIIEHETGWNCRLAGEWEEAELNTTKEEAIAFLMQWQKDDRAHWKKEFRL